MAARRQSTGINAGSMADIAFLLLLFFLVSTTISTDKGIERKLPKPCPPNTDCTDNISSNNILSISLNTSNQIFVRDKIVAITEIKDMIKEFIDNNGSGYCEYCIGVSQPDLSDHPNKAVIAIANTHDTSYEFYIEVQDQITKAYLELRLQYAKKILNKTESELNEEDIKKLKQVYPFKLSESNI